MSNKIIHNAIPVKFLILAGLLLLGWIVMYEAILKPIGQPDDALTSAVAHTGKSLLNVFGIHVEVVRAAENVKIWYQGHEVLWIANNCNGLAVLCLFAGFISIFPGKAMYKLWFIPLGIALLFMLNAFRVALLIIIQIHYPEWLDFNHTYTFSILIYSFVFLFWVCWVKLHKYSSQKECIQEKQLVS